MALSFGSLTKILPSSVIPRNTIKCPARVKVPGRILAITGLCLVESANANAEKREAYSEVFLQIINLRNDIISRISHTEPGSVKLFYKKLRADFNAEVDNVFKKLEELSK